MNEDVADKILAVTLPVCGLLLVISLMVAGYHCDHDRQQTDIKITELCVNAGGSIIGRNCILPNKPRESK